MSDRVGDLGVDAALHLPPRTVAWLADHPHARRFVRAVWDTLAELERSGHHPGALDALRWVLTRHQPTSAGRCRTCPRVAGRRPAFPCTVWHQIRLGLLGMFAGGQHRQPAGQGSSPGPRGSDTAPVTADPTAPGRGSTRHRIAYPAFRDAQEAHDLDERIEEFCTTTAARDLPPTKFAR